MREICALPVPVEAYDVVPDEPDRIRLFVAEPVDAIAEAHAYALPDAGAPVAISLCVRELIADGYVLRTGPAHVSVIALDLAGPLGNRAVVDAWSGQPVPSVDALDDGDPLAEAVRAAARDPDDALWVPTGRGVAVAAADDAQVGTASSAPSPHDADGHPCLVVAPGGDVTLARNPNDGRSWSASGPGGLADGPLAYVLTWCAVDADPEWVAAVVSAVEREIDELGDFRWRTGLIVRRATADDAYVHVTRSVNRASILEHGLDWRRMGAAPGIAGSATAERRGVFLDREGPTSFFRSFTDEPTDVWAVDAEGLWIESAPDCSGGLDDLWAICPTPIATDRLRLVARGANGPGGASRT